MRHLILLLAACDGDKPTPRADPCDAPFAAELLDPAEGATMVHGPQGGWHVWAGADLVGTGSIVGAQITITRVADGTTVSEGFENLTTMDLTDPSAGTWDPETCTGSFSRAWAYLNDDLPSVPLDLICDLEGEELQIDATVTELQTGEAVQTSVVSTAALDPSDVAACHP